MKDSLVNFNQYRQHKKNKWRLIRLIIYCIVIGGLFVYLQLRKKSPTTETKTNTIEHFSVTTDSLSQLKIVQ